MSQKRVEKNVLVSHPCLKTMCPLHLHITQLHRPRHDMLSHQHRSLVQQMHQALHPSSPLFRQALGVLSRATLSWMVPRYLSAENQFPGYHHKYWRKTLKQMLGTIKTGQDLLTHYRSYKHYGPHSILNGPQPAWTL